MGVIGYLAGASSPNSTDHKVGFVIVGYAIVMIALALFAPEKVSRAVFFGSIALVALAYALPMSFWNLIGLNK